MAVSFINSELSAAASSDSATTEITISGATDINLISWVFSHAYDICDEIKEAIENSFYLHVKRKNLFDKKDKNINENKKGKNTTIQNIKLFTKRNMFNRQHKV